MEKLIYVVWKEADACVRDFKQELLGPVAEELLKRGARKLSMSIADELAEYAQASRITQMTNPMSATISLWLDTALARAPFERAIASAATRYTGHLVTESVPIVNTTHTAPVGERTPGINTIAFLEKPDSMTYEAWLDQWQGHHTQVAIDTQSTFLYIQNVVVRTLTEGAPPWTAIVEEGFPGEALTDPMVFYAAGNSEEKLTENRNQMIESCRKFIDFSRLESHPMSEYILKN
jgi:hypothetical protein